MGWRRCHSVTRWNASPAAMNFRAGNTQGVLETFAAVASTPSLVQAPIDTDACSPQVAIQVRQITRYRFQHGRRIFRIRSSNRAQYRAAIHGTSRHRPDVIQRRGEFEDAVAADPPPGRLQAGHTVDG